MPANNSKTNRSIRRAAALERFKMDPARLTDDEYQKRKEQELEALKRAVR